MSKIYNLERKSIHRSYRGEKLWNNFHRA